MRLHCCFQRNESITAARSTAKSGRLHRRVLSPFRLAFHVTPEASFFSTCKFRLRFSRVRRYALMENSSNNEWHTTDMRRPFREGGVQRAFLQSLVFSALDVSVCISIIRDIAIPLEITNGNQHAHKTCVTCLVSVALSWNPPLRAIAQILTLVTSCAQRAYALLPASMRAHLGSA